MSKHVRASEGADVNITPLLDVVFIMLIFFIVTTSFVTVKAIDLNQPSSKPTDKPPTGIVVTITSGDEILINGRTIDPRQVAANVQAQLAKTPTESLIIVADRASSTQAFVTVADAARATGLDVALVERQ